MLNLELVNLLLKMNETQAFLHFCPPLKENFRKDFSQNIFEVELSRKKILLYKNYSFQ